jgi:hypothetical protein
MNNRIGPISASILGITIGLGILIAGLSIGNALYKARAVDRYVAVKGLAEREVNADLAIWPIVFKVAGNDLTALQHQIDGQRQTITDYLVSKGFKKTDISYGAPRIFDSQAENYGQSNMVKFRYKMQASITLRSQEVGLVKSTMEAAGELVAKGIVLADTWESRPEFLFTSLNDIKPDMIREATINARKAAEKFAEDSGSSIGKIRKATQGLFSISNRDQNTPEVKIVRVVTNMEYFLD